MQQKIKKPTSKGTTLTYSDLLFCMEYVKNGQNGTQAYKTVHPKANNKTAGVLACRRLEKASVKEQLTRLYRAAIPDTIESIKSDLELAWAMALEAKDYDAIDRISMDKAKLAGLLVEKREIKEVSDTDRSAIASLVRSTIPNLSSDNLNNS